MINLAQLRKLALKATQGKWEAVRQDDDDGSLWWDIWSNECESVAHCSEHANMIMARRNANYLAAVSPQTILKLIDVAIAAQEINDILTDVDSREFIDSFTAQPLTNALRGLE